MPNMCLHMYQRKRSREAMEGKVSWRTLSWKIFMFLKIGQDWEEGSSGNLELSVSCVSISCVLLCLDKTQKLYVAYPYHVSYCVLMIVCNIQCQHTNSQHTTTYRVNTHCPHTPHTSARYSNQDTILKTHSNIQCQHTDAELYCVLMLYVIVCGCVFIMCVNVCWWMW